MFDNQRLDRGARLILMFVSMALLTASSVFLFGQSPNGLLLSCLYCFVFGEFCLLAIWGVFAPGNWLVRWLPSALGAVVLGVCYSLGDAWGRGQTPLRDPLGYIMENGDVFLSLPLFLFAAQLPLFFIRLSFGFRLVPDIPAYRVGLPRTGHFEISDLIGSLTSVPVIVVMRQIAASVPHARHESLSFLQFVVLAGMLTGICTLILPPCFYAVLSAVNRADAIVYAFLWSAFVMAVPGIAALLFIARVVRCTSIDWETAYLMSLGGAVALATILLGIYLMSQCGYGLALPKLARPMNIER